ncbi:NADPH dehydrogenase [Chaetomium tenue]|uniref:NADPH dehydrogenase n=1 Tax=Chaetomium tenue TaxID=1854479 RepID=A0ACB7PLS0_9PEZI|nr:NADPH dehydrogenase [Chaetomium globosum]
MGGPSDLQIAQPLTLKCGLTLPNRLVKAAMAEQMAGPNQLPDERMLTLYKHWAQGGWGLIITGHVHIDDAHLGAPADPALSPSLPSDTLITAYSALARASQTTNPQSASPPKRNQPGHTPTIIQLNHPGRQSPRGAGTRSLLTPALAPSAVPLSLGPGLLARALRVLAFGTPKAMSVAEIEGVVGQFARAARREGEVGEWVEQVRAVVEEGVDFVEVSGGSYEDPKMIWGNDGPDGAQEEKSDRTKAREAFFLEFARLIRKEFPDVPLMVTGGFSSRGGMERAVVDGDCDLIGLARPAVLNPLLPNNLVLNSEVKDQDARVYRRKHKTPWFAKFLGLPVIGAGMDSQFYVNKIHEMAKA